MPFQVHVRDFARKVITVDGVFGAASVAFLKAKLLSKTCSVPPIWPLLKYESTLLDDDRTLAAYVRQKFLDGVDGDWATGKWSKIGYDALHFMHNCQRMLNIDKHSQIARIFSALLSDVLFQIQDGEKERVYEHLRKMGEVDPEKRKYKRIRSSTRCMVCPTVACRRTCARGCGRERTRTRLPRSASNSTSLGSSASSCSVCRATSCDQARPRSSRRRKMRSKPCAIKTLQRWRGSSRSIPR